MRACRIALVIISGSASAIPERAGPARIHTGPTSEKARKPTRVPPRSRITGAIASFSDLPAPTYKIPALNRPCGYLQETRYQNQRHGGPPQKSDPSETNK